MWRLGVPFQSCSDILRAIGCISAFRSPVRAPAACMSKVRRIFTSSFWWSTVGSAGHSYCWSCSKSASQSYASIGLCCGSMLESVICSFPGCLAMMSAMSGSMVPSLSRALTHLLRCPVAARSSIFPGAICASVWI
jgi:hypothetical protein